MARPVNVEKIEGFFLPWEKEPDEGSSSGEEISDDEDFVDFSDDNIFLPKSDHVEAVPVKCTSAKFQDYKTKNVYWLEGQLQFHEPWWAAVVSVRKSRGLKRKVVGFPAYRLRNDARVITDKVVLLFMAACKVDSQHVELFTDFLRLNNLETQLDFEHFPELLRQFGESSPENGDIARTVNLLTSAGPGLFVRKCSGLEEFYRLMPQLLPHHFTMILRKYHKTITELQLALLEEPWIFAFSPILSKKYNMFGCEAQLQNIYNSGLVEDFPPEIKDALHIYQVLKQLSRHLGHTYCYAGWLPVCKFFNGYKVSHWAEALAFLEENEVIVRETSEQEAKVFLSKLWGAENNIAQGVKLLFERHLEEPWTFDIDFNQPRFTGLQKDVDQMNAAMLISQRPLVVLSGKGGCGKTTVVSAVFQYAEQLIREEDIKLYQEQMFAADDLDDQLLTQSALQAEETFFTSQGEQNQLASSGSTEHSLTNKCNESMLKRGQARFEKLVNGGMADATSGEESSAADVARGIGEAKESEDEKYPVILLTAPTGKAANLLGARSHLPSFTLHQVIYSYWNWRRGESSSSGDLKWKFSEVRALVVDECSLVSVSTFNAMFNALLQHASLQKVVLLGDVNQLPSIEPGNFLADIFQALKDQGCSAMLTHNHRTDSKLLTDNASLIAEQKLPVVDPTRSFYQIDLEELARGIRENSSQDDLGIDQDQAIRQLLKSKNPSLNGHEKSQFVAFRRRDCEAINEICCKHYANHLTRNVKGRVEFQVGDKVCCTKNALIKDEISGKDRRLCNGEIFFIVEDKVTVEADGKKKHEITLRDDEGKLVKTVFPVLKYKCKLKHAWARTIHTYQGSESDTVIYVVGSPGGQTWQHVYTAVTRGRMQVVMVTRKSHLERAISNNPLTRRTSLREKLLDKLKSVFREEATPRKRSKPKQTHITDYISPSKCDPVLIPLVVPCTSTSSNQQGPGADIHNGHDKSVDSFSDWDEFEDVASGQFSQRLHDDSMSQDQFSDWGEDAEVGEERFSDWEDDFLEDCSNFEAAVTASMTAVHHKRVTDPLLEVHVTQPSNTRSDDAVCNTTGGRQQSELIPADLCAPQSSNNPRDGVRKDSNKLRTELFREIYDDFENTGSELLENSKTEYGNPPVKNSQHTPTTSSTTQRHRRNLDFGTADDNSEEDLLADLLSFDKPLCSNNSTAEDDTPADFYSTNKPMCSTRVSTSHSHSVFTAIHSAVPDDSMNQSTMYTNQSPLREAGLNNIDGQTDFLNNHPVSSSLSIGRSKFELPSPKRTADSYAEHGAQKRQNFGPVTSASISPLRSTLLNISLSNSGPSGHNHDVNRT